MSDANSIRRRLWYQKPAMTWVEALPVGNGRLGGMVFGDPRQERIQLNEDTLWSGRPRDRNNYQAYDYLLEARQLIFSGEYQKAQKLIEAKMQGTYTEAYQPLGVLIMENILDGEVTDYYRELDLERSVVTVSFVTRTGRQIREIFCSYPDQVLVIRQRSEKPGQVNFKLSLESPHRCRVSPEGGDCLVLDGRCPVSVVPRYAAKLDNYVIYEDDVSEGMRYRIQVKAAVDQGTLSVEGGELVAANATSATIILAAATSFNGFDKNPHIEGKDPKASCAAVMEALAEKTYDELLKAHVEDYQGLFNRVTLDLGEPLHPNLPTDEWLERVRQGEPDPALVALYFDFGRYLMISASRPGTQPANLQGIWNDQVEPPWSCNYTTNINLEMNYWPAEVCNLAECHQPLFDLIEDLVITGGKTARVHYNARGWTAHHNVDIWRHSAPVCGSAKWAFWPMAGAWLSRHLWEHFAYSGDVDFLRTRAYPIMKGAALFCLDWLMTDSEGNLVTCPSTSPENEFICDDGRKAAVSYGSTMDMSLIWDLFTNCIEAGAVLNTDASFRRDLEAAREQLLPLQVGSSGQLQEWNEDFEEASRGHRHFSHLFGLYPGRQILKHKHPCLSKACEVSIRRRLEHGGGSTGWSCAWLVCLLARLEDGDQACHYLGTLLRNFTYDNLFNAHPPFQIDGNFGAVAGIAEMLIQSHAGELNLLPALPRQWTTGSAAGLRARQGFTVDLAWADGRLTTAVVKASLKTECKIRYGYPLEVFSGGRKIAVEIDGELISFTAEAGGVYEVKRSKK